jgi:serine protease AprX
MNAHSPAARGVSSRSRTVRTAILLSLLAGAGLVVQGSSPGHRARVSSDLLSHEARHSRARVRVIVHGTPDEISALAERHHVAIIRTVGDSAVLAANSAEISELASDPFVDHLSADARVRVDMSVSNISTAADKVRAGVPGLLGIGAIAGVTGKGIGVAVLDSGITPHAALKNVVANVSYVTGNSSVLDQFGHGTHVAGIVGGNASAAKYVTGLYTGGIAPGVQIVNVRVLGPDGTGLTSDVIAGIEWVINHKAQYNIRVINLSLGHPVTQKAADDPLCEEVEKATTNGIVVVASAGNAGKATNGAPILGGISSPGNSPSAITVGALNTWQTTGRADDSVTTYSSRGPTRYDLAVKPDVVAPGNKIVSLEAAGSYLSAAYSPLHIAGSASNAYMRLSGTSMAAPMVSGAVALLLQGTPGLSAAQIKLALQTGASYVPDGGLMGAGAGSVNFWEARQTAANGLGSLLNRITGSLLGPSGAAFWDTGTMTQRLYDGVGLRLLSILELPAVWLNPSLLHYGDLNLVGLLNPLATTPKNPLIWGEVASWTSNQQVLWGDVIYNPEGQQVLWGDSQAVDDSQVLWGDAILTSADPR